MVEKKGKSKEKVKQCFVISPIGEEGSEIRKRSDQLLRHVITPAAENCGYKVTRADQISEPGIITSQVVQRIVRDDLVIADLTGRNPNVFYELAVRHSIKKPIVQIIQKGEQIPFDVAATRTIYVDHRDLDSVEEAKAELVKQIKTVEKDPSKVDSPISVALELQLLKDSGVPEQKRLGDLLLMMEEMRISVERIQRKISDPTELLPPGYVRDLTRLHTSRIPEGLIREFKMILSRLRDPAVRKDEKMMKTLSERLADILGYLIHESIT